MTTLFQSAADFEPGEKWKSRLKLDIEDNLRSMVDKAEQGLLDMKKLTQRCRTRTLDRATPRYHEEHPQSCR
ncbi:hypothetical protein BDR07DRAFT_865475 [Suillus spraguei]|nr:hypothetical protein BDR07DRAFT_865475 [Suillus spraguei]